MTNQEETTGAASEEATSERRRIRITGLSDLLPDWILPPEGKDHLRSARREVLLAVRSVLDGWIERVESAPPAARRPTKIEIE